MRYVNVLPISPFIISLKTVEILELYFYDIKVAVKYNLMYNM